MNRSPLKSLREDCDLTLEKVASRTGLSKQFIIKAEQAVYTEPPDGLMSYYAALVEFSVTEVVKEYHIFQREMRIASYGKLIEPWIFVGTEHPFKNWRKLSGMDSLSGLCRDFCVHPAVMTKFENQSYLLNSVPDQLVSALLESGYSVSTLQELEKAYSDYKAFIRLGVTVATN